MKADRHITALSNIKNNLNQLMDQSEYISPEDLRRLVMKCYLNLVIVEGAIVKEPTND